MEKTTAEKISEALSKAAISAKQANESLKRISEAWSRFSVISTLAPHRKDDD